MKADESIPTDNSRFQEFPPIFYTALAAKTFASGFDSPRVVVKIGRRFGVVAPDVAKRLGLKEVRHG